jgi:hypothetical protein
MPTLDREIMRIDSHRFYAVRAGIVSVALDDTRARQTDADTDKNVERWDHRRRETIECDPGT